MLAAVLLACLLAAGCYGAALPADGDLVLTMEKNSSDPTTADLTTEEPPLPIKLLEMDVRSEVALRYAQTSVVTKVRNPGHLAQETTFRLLLPETAFISGFVMILNGKPYKAYVKEKKEAKEIYNQAVSQGLGAAHVATKARDSNHFTVSVNVEPRTEAVFNLTYEELLVRRNGVYNQAINLHPGGLVPSFKVTVHIKESQKITVLSVPEVRTGNEVDATSDDKQNSMAKIERGHDDREATISFSPDLEEQRRLIEIYAAKSKESASHVNYYQPPGDEDKAPKGVLGQFVVQYDVERPQDGEILVSDGYFVHFFAPHALPPLSKLVVFVLDTSGSMQGAKIEQLREALKSILDQLNPGDFFTIVEFSSSVKVHELKEADEDARPMPMPWDSEPSPVNLVPPSPVTPENIAKAKVIVSRLLASGGTNIAQALDVAVTLVNRGVEWKLRADSNSSTQAAAETTTKAADKEEKKVEPIILFLTDGQPNDGETDPRRILNGLAEKNDGPNKATIFSLAFGEDADRSFLRKVALRNAGFMRHIYEGADAVLQLRDFYRQVASPLLSHVNFTYPPEQVVEGSVTSSKFRNYYAGSERAVAGRVAPDATELSPSVEAFCGLDDSFTRKKYRVSPKVPVAGNRAGFLPLERVWAYLTVQQLLEQRDASTDPDVYVSDNDKQKSPEKRALEIALKYEFVTPLTSLVIVNPNSTKTVDAESVDRYGSGNNFASHYAAMSAAGPAAPSSLFLNSYASISHYADISAAGPVLYFSNPKPNRRMWIGQGSNIQLDRTRFRTSAWTKLQLSRNKGLSGAQHYAAFSAPQFDAMDFAIDEEEDIDMVVSDELMDLIQGRPDANDWLAPYLAVGAISFQVNGTEVVLKLTETPVDPGASCDKDMPSGVLGRCVYVKQCLTTTAIDLDTYKNKYCSLGNEGFAGICCHPDNVNLPVSSTAKAP